MGRALAVTRDSTQLEERLDSFDDCERREALAALWDEVQQGRIHLPSAGERINLHCHTVFSYNAYGYSPSKFAWLARKAGLAVAGIADFDVLDGLDEFLRAGAQLDLRTCAGLETRVYVPEFADFVINSPGEPGISYHMGVGFPTSELQPPLVDFLRRLRRTSEERNRALVKRVNAFLDPVVLSYEEDVLPLTPSGNATERHICLAYARKARAVFSDSVGLGEFWAEKLGVDPRELDLPAGLSLQSLIRLKTMKRGGAGYVQPDSGSFPWMQETNQFILAAGGIPTHTWLDGTSEGESRIEELLAVAMSTGVAAINVIPDRNYTAGSPGPKLENLRQVVAVADDLGLLVVSGTEMNSPGQPFVDDFDSPELLPLAPVLLKAAYAIYAHSVLQGRSGMGYTSEWAARHFPDRADRNEFFRDVGLRLRPSNEQALGDLHPRITPKGLLDRLPH
jgi:hypothetical protein